MQWKGGSKGLGLVFNSSFSPCVHISSVCAHENVITLNSIFLLRAPYISSMPWGISCILYVLVGVFFLSCSYDWKFSRNYDGKLKCMKNYCLLEKKHPGKLTDIEKRSWLLYRIFPSWLKIFHNLIKLLQLQSIQEILNEILIS